MNFKHVWIVFKKEVKDMGRDKKTLLTNLLIPIILMPLLFYLMSGSFEKMEKDIVENIPVAISSDSDTQEIRDLLQNDIFANYPNIVFDKAVEDPMQAVRAKVARFVISIDKDYAQNLANGSTYQITIIYDHSDTKSQGSYGILVEAIDQYNQRIVSKRLEDINIDPQILEPARIVQSNASEEKTGGNMMIMMMLPMLISILIAVGGIPAATDLVSGEKERGTFEPLLTTQAGRMSILLGKYFTVTLFSIVSVIAQFIGVVIGGIISPGFFTLGEAGAEISFYIPTGALILTILITITLGMVFAGLQLAVSTYARSFKEAQTYLSFFIIIAMIPAYATMMMQPDDITMGMFFVPLLNAIASLKMVLGNVINYGYLAISLGTSLIYVMLSLLFASSLFNKEKVLFRS